MATERQVARRLFERVYPGVNSERLTSYRVGTTELGARSRSVRIDDAESVTRLPFQN